MVFPDIDGGCAAPGRSSGRYIAIDPRGTNTDADRGEPVNCSRVSSKILEKSVQYHGNSKIIVVKQDLVLYNVKVM